MALIDKIQEALQSLKLTGYDSINEEIVEEHFLKEFVENDGDKKILTGQKVLIMKHIDHINNEILGDKLTRGQKIIEQIENESKSDKEVWASIKFFNLQNKVRLSEISIDKAWTKMITKVEDYEKEIVNSHKKVLLANVKNTNRVLHLFNGVEDDYRDEEDVNEVVNRKIDLTTSVNLDSGKNKLFNENSQVFNIKKNKQEELKDFDTPNVKSSLMAEFTQKFEDIKNYKPSTNSQQVQSQQPQNEVCKASDANNSLVLTTAHDPKKPAIIKNNNISYRVTSPRFIPSGIKINVDRTFTRGAINFADVSIVDEEENMNRYNKMVSHYENQNASNALSWFAVIILIIITLLFFSFAAENIVEFID